MSAERARLDRLIERLLDAAGTAAEQEDWPRVADLAQRVLAADPTNGDAAALAALAGLPDTSATALETRPAAPLLGPFGPSGPRVREVEGDIVGERRIVTVLFADAAGSTSLGERLGEEVMYRTMQECLGVMSAAVAKHQGAVTQFHGDGIMALFGAPNALENAAVRAGRAALDMLAALETVGGRFRAAHADALVFRVGLNTGPVVVGSISPDLQMDFTAIGDTVNLAARMEQTAPPGAAQLTAATASAVAGFLTCVPLGAVEVKGKAAPVQVFELAAGAPDESFEASEFTGREDDLAVLRSHLRRSEQAGAQVVLVVGEPGIGKSRLLRELRRSPGRSVRWLGTRCVAYAPESPLSALAELVRDRCGLDAAASGPAVAAALDTDAEADIWDPDRRHRRHLQTLLDLAADPAGAAQTDPALLRAGMIDALVAMLHAEASTQPLVVCVEDWHWADPAARSVLLEVWNMLGREPITTVLSTRPAAGLGEGLANPANVLNLSGLDAPGCATLARTVVGLRRLDEALGQALAERTGGNPLFVQELIRELVETGALDPERGALRGGRSLDKLGVPARVHDVILSRLDRLALPARELLQNAAVLGRSFSLPVLELMQPPGPALGTSIEELRRTRLINQGGLEAERTYEFAHALIHDVTYATLLSDRRARLHARAAEAIVAQRSGAEHGGADQGGADHEALAFHYLRSGQDERALTHLVQSAERAWRSHAFDRMEALAAQASEIAERVEPGEEYAQLLLMLSDLHIARSALDRADVSASRVLALSENPKTRASAANQRSMTALFAHRFDEAAAHANQARRLADGIDPGEVVNADTLLAMAHVMLGEFAESAAAIERARADRVHGPTRARWLVGVFEHWRGAERDLSPDFEELQHADDDVRAQIGAHVFCGLAASARGQYRHAIAEWAAGVALARRVHDPLTPIRDWNYRGHLHSELLDPTTARDLNQRCLDELEANRIVNPEIEFNARLNLVDNLLDLGELAEAARELALIEPAVRNPTGAQRYQHWRYSQHFFVNAADLAIAQGHLDTARAHAGECLDLAVATSSKRYLAKARLLIGRIDLAAGNLDSTAASLEQSLHLAHQLANPPQQWHARLALAQLHDARRDPNAALEQRRAALTVIERTADELDAGPLLNAFLGAPLVTTLRVALSQAADA